MTAPANAPFDADRIENLVTSALNAIVSAAASFTPAVSLPGRQIAGAGLIPYDCEQVYVSFLTSSLGTPEPLGASGVSTWPAQADGANQTLYNAVLQLAIVRPSQELIQGMGNAAPPTTQYLANLAQISQDTAVLMAAINQIATAQMSATPRTITAGSPQGALVATTCRLTVLC